MSNLIQSYSLNTGLKIGKPFIFQSPYSLPFDRYITIGAGSGNPCKNYAYWQEVIDILLPYLKEADINIVQLGSTGEHPIENAKCLQGLTTVHQSAFIVKNALLHVGNDSMLVHMAGALETPIVALYGPTTVANHGPYFKTDNSIFIESHRNGKLPSFSFNENPKTVDMIKPEEVVTAILKILGIEQKDKITSLYFGPKYGQRVIECTVDNLLPTDFLPEVPINIRYDYLENLQGLANQLSVRKALVVTDKPIDINVLKALKQNIFGVAYEITENNDSKFANEVRNAGIEIKLFSKLSEEKLNPIKLAYFDVGIIEQEKIFKKEDLEKHMEINSNTFFKSRKILFSRGKSYLSKIHFLLDMPMENMNAMVTKVIETPKFYEESEFFYFFNQS